VTGKINTGESYTFPVKHFSPFPVSPDMFTQPVNKNDIGTRAGARAGD
jgi:hypothetical protein